MKNVDKPHLRKIKSVTNPVMKRLLKTAMASGIAGVILGAQTPLQAFDKLIKQVDETKKRTKRFSEYARNSDYFKIVECGKNQYSVTLTAKGNNAAQNLLYDDYALPIKEKWDGNWHILAFDIAEQNKYLRDLLSNKVTEIGMLKLQNSMYVYPYDFSDFIKSLHAVYPQATQYVMSVVASHIDGEEQLVKKFRKNRVL